MAPPRRFNSEEEVAIVARYQSGATLNEIATSLHVLRSTVTGVLKRRGVTIRHHQHTLAPEQEQEVVRRFNAGETAREIAKDFGIDHTTVSTITRRCGGELRRKGRARKFASRRAWEEHPRTRLRKLLHTARAGARARGEEFDDELLRIFPENPSTKCAACGKEFDYAVRSRAEAMISGRGPSFDRCNNDVGYTRTNVYMLCWRCNYLKRDATLDELRSLVSYMERHFQVSS